MTACIIGNITSIRDRHIFIEDRLTKEIYECETDNDEFLDLKEGDQGVFVGQMIKSQLKVKRVEIRKFLDPMYESDLYDASGKFNLVPILSDPFTETYLDFLEQQKAIEEELLEQEANND